MRVDDYSTETGLRVRIASTSTGTVVQLTADEWQQLMEEIKAGEHDELALQPRVPFLY